MSDLRIRWADPILEHPSDRRWRVFDAYESRYALEPAHELTPEKLFERQWALALLDQVLQRLRNEMIAAGNVGGNRQARELIG